MTTSVTIPVYQELDPDQYSRLQRALLKTKGGDRQREFLENLKVNTEFVAWIETQVQPNEGRTLPTFDGPLTETSFREPTPDQEARMYDLWKDAPPRIACRSSFWGSVTLEHIRQDKISEATWLAINGGNTENGEERIDHALAQGTDKEIDDCVRTALRRMSGLPAARGNRSVFVDTPFGRAYWRERIVATILQKGDGVADRPALVDVVRNNQAYWESLVTMIVSRGSVFGSAEVQAALINTLAHRFQENPKTPLSSNATLRTALRRFSNLAASREISVLPFPEICDIIDDLLTRVENAQSK